ncbi:MAG TPA: amidohydrolase family protein [Planctomycetota bacterium]|nr:amidohydrolase family protein [Planctomycetota bacterium]
MRMLDVRSGVMVDDPWILVEDGKITSIEHEIPGDIRVIELGDSTLLPGLIDCHVHLSGSLEGDFVNRVVHESAVDDAMHTVANAKKTLDAGFTTVRNVGCSDYVDVALMNAVERGEIEGPWIIPAGYSIGITGGHADETGFRPGLLLRGPEQGIADGPDECRKAVRAQLKYGAKVIKCIATAGVLSFEDSVGAQQLSDEELAAVVDEATRHGVKVCAHAHGAKGILAAVKAGVASIEHGSMIDEACIAEMKKRGTYLVPTSYLATGIDLENLPPKLRSKAESILPLARKNLTAAMAAGVKIAFGTDAAVIPHGVNAREFAVYVECGMSPLDAIRTATINAADLCGVKDRGELAPGMLADIVAVPGNPLEDVKLLEKISFVMHHGKQVR